MSGLNRAIMAMDCCTWYLFVHPVSGPWLAHCCEYYWADGGDIPTPAQRRAALVSLGYQVAPGSAWEWTEVVPGGESADEDTPVSLLAAIDVHPVGGESA